MVISELAAICPEYEKIVGYDQYTAHPNQYELFFKLETQTSDGTPRPIDCILTQRELKAMGCYYNQPAHMLEFMTPTDWAQLCTKNNVTRNICIDRLMQLSMEDIIDRIVAADTTTAPTWNDTSKKTFYLHQAEKPNTYLSKDKIIDSAILSWREWNEKYGKKPTNVEYYKCKRIATLCS